MDTKTTTQTTGTWAVEDPAGRLWFPDDDAAREIEASEDPGATAERICRDTPERGMWILIGTIEVGMIGEDTV